jgi:hypothetical protein
LRPGNVHSAEGWREVLEPVIARYRTTVKRRYFRADAGFASPAFNYPHLGSGIASFAPRAMSVSRERPRQMTVFPGGGSRVRAR